VVPGSRSKSDENADYLQSPEQLQMLAPKELVTASRNQKSQHTQMEWANVGRVRSLNLPIEYLACIDQASFGRRFDGPGEATFVVN